MDDSEPTYAAAAKWLPTDVREAIERAMSCRVYGEHDGRHMRTEIHTWGQVEPVNVIETWECPCGLVHTTDPHDGNGAGPTTTEGRR